jgi:hypothetical protein
MLHIEEEIAQERESVDSTQATCLLLTLDQTSIVVRTRETIEIQKGVWNGKEMPAATVYVTTVYVIVIESKQHSQHAQQNLLHSEDLLLHERFYLLQSPTHLHPPPPHPRLTIQQRKNKITTNILSLRKVIRRITIVKYTNANTNTNTNTNTLRLMIRT